MLAFQDHDRKSLEAGKPRVALVTNVLAHYRVLCFRKLLHLMPGSIDVFVLTERMNHRDYVLARGQNGLPVTCLKGWRWPRPPHDDVHLSDVRPIIHGDYNTFILGGWNEPTYLLLWLWGVMRKKRVFFWVESTVLEGPRRGMKESFKRGLLAKATGCIVSGKRAFAYCRKLGMPASRIFTAPNATDREYFRRQAGQLLPRRESLRQEARVEGLGILFVGRLVEELKGVATLIRACARLQGEREKFTLLIVGEGPDQRRYEELIDKLNLERTRFLGTLDHEKLCRYYALADVLVQPSHSETWGFVLNEGMEFGLPLVVSEAVGAGPDLVRPGENGFVFPVGDESALEQILLTLMENEEIRQKMGRASRAIIEHFSPENWAKGVLRGINGVYG